MLVKDVKDIEFKGTKHTLSPAIELYADLFVHVFIQVEDVFLLGLFLLSTATTATFSMAAAAARAIISSAAAATTSTE